VRSIKKYTSPLLFCLTSLSSVCFLSAAHAEDTMDRIMKTHTVNIGVRNGVVPFSSLDPSGKAQGYSIDVCYKIVELMRKEIKVPDLHVNEVQVSAANRFDKVKDGSIDLECTMTSNVKSRGKDFDFTYAVMFGAQRFLADKQLNIYSQNDLDGKNVVVVKGTAAEKIMTTLQKKSLPNMKLLHAADNLEALKMLDGGQAQAFLQMDLLLENLRLTSKNPARLALSQWPLTVEPISFPMRKNDPRFRDAVNNALRTLYQQNDYMTIYNHWFDGKVKIPLSGLMRENLQRPAADPGFSLIEGVDL